MAKGPAVWVFIDGIDGVGKTTAGHSIAAVLDIPYVRAGRTPDGKPWINEIRKWNDLVVMSTLLQVHEYLPSVVFDRSLVSVCAYNQTIDPSKLPWETYYPKERSVFITLIDDIERTIKSEGVEVYRPLMVKRIHEQMAFLEMSRFMGQRGYRTKIVPASGGPEDTYKAIVAYIRAMQLDILDSIRNEGEMEDD